MKIFLRNFFTFFIIIFFTTISSHQYWLNSIDNSSPVGNGDSLLDLIIRSIIYLIVAILLVLNWRYVTKLWRINKFIWVVIFWTLASFFWSVEPLITLKGVTNLCGVTITGLYIASFYDYKNFSKITSWAYFFIILFSFIIIILFPSKGIMTDPPGWRGIFGHKNSLGQFSLFCIILFPAFFGSGKNKIPWIIGFVLSWILLIGSQSATALIIAMASIFLWFILYAYQKKSKPTFIFLFDFIFIILMLSVWLYYSNNVEIVFNTLGKDMTLTGRTKIWNAVLLFVKESPWLGFGYSAVWLGPDYGIGSIIGKLIDNYLTTHNGYLNTILETGMIGLTFVCLVLITNLHRFFSNICNSNRISYYTVWPAIFLLAILIYNLTEGLLMGGNIFWVFLAYFCFRNPKNDINRQSSIKL